MMFDQDDKAIMTDVRKSGKWPATSPGHHGLPRFVVRAVGVSLGTGDRKGDARVARCVRTLTQSQPRNPAVRSHGLLFG